MNRLSNCYLNKLQNTNNLTENVDYLAKTFIIKLTLNEKMQTNN